MSTREHLLRVKKQTGYVPEGLKNPTKFPELLAHVWSFFIELNQARPSGMNGPESLSYSEIQSWMNLTGNTPSPRDIKLIKKLDRTYLEVYHNG